MVREPTPSEGNQIMYEDGWAFKEVTIIIGIVLLIAITIATLKHYKVIDYRDHHPEPIEVRIVK